METPNYYQPPSAWELKDKIKEEIQIIARARISFGWTDSVLGGFVDDCAIYLSRTPKYKFHLGVLDSRTTKLTPGNGLNHQFVIQGENIPIVTEEPGPAEPHLRLEGHKYWVGFRIQENETVVKDFMYLLNLTIETEKFKEMPVDYKDIDNYAKRVSKVAKKSLEPELQRLQGDKNPLYQGMVDVRDRAVRGLQTVGNPVYQGLMGVGNPVYRELQSVANPLYQGLQNVGNPVYHGLQSVTNPVIHGLQNVGNPVYQGLQSAGNTAYHRVMDGASQGLRTIRNPFFRRS